MKKRNNKAGLSELLASVSRPTYTVRLSNPARKELDKLPDEAAGRITEAVAKLAFDPRPPGVVKLTDQEGYRIRVGNYRVSYSIFDKVLLVEVVKVGKRGNFYDR